MSVLISLPDQLLVTLYNVQCPVFVCFNFACSVNKLVIPEYHCQAGFDHSKNWLEQFHDAQRGVYLNIYHKKAGRLQQLRTLK